MAANLYERSFVSNKVSSWHYLADSELVMDVTIIASSKNTGNLTVQFIGMSGDAFEIMTAAWPPGATVQLRNVDLSKISAYVMPGQHVLVVGQAP